MQDNDERLGRVDNSDPREDRAMQDREVTEDRELTDAERLKLFQEDHFQAALPDLPKKPGYHMCWLSTTSQSSPINRKIRLGYKLCKPADIPGFDFYLVNSGAYEGYIGVNEMVAAMIPTSLYKQYMKISHHDMPNEQEGAILDAASEMADKAKDAGSRMEEGEGFRAMRLNQNRRAQFSDD